MDTIETKFRAWYENKLHYNVSKMCHGLYWDKTGDFNIFAFKNPQNKLMQYTGLKDKNNKEIYEGDIVESSGSMVFSNPNVPAGLIRIVKKLHSGFTLVTNNDFEIPNIISNISNYTFWNTQRDWTIIGNIYDNPELFSKDA